MAGPMPASAFRRPSLDRGAVVVPARRQGSGARSRRRELVAARLGLIARRPGPLPDQCRESLAVRRRTRAAGRRPLSAALRRRAGEGGHTSCSVSGRRGSMAPTSSSAGSRAGKRRLVWTARLRDAPRRRATSAAGCRPRLDRRCARLRRFRTVAQPEPPFRERHPRTFGVLRATGLRDASWDLAPGPRPRQVPPQPARLDADGTGVRTAGPSARQLVGRGGRSRRRWRCTGCSAPRCSRS